MKNMKTAKKTVLFSIFLWVFFFGQILVLTPQAKANSLWDKQQGLGTPGDTAVANSFGETGGSTAPTDIRIIVARIIKIFLGFIGIIFLTLIILAGYKWMTAGGNDEKAKEAMGQLKTAIIGLIIIIAAYAITDYVTSNVIQIQKPSIEG